MGNQFDKEKAFTPYTEEETRKIEAEKKEAQKLSQQIKENASELIVDPKYIKLKELMEERMKMHLDLILKMNMQDPMRFAAQAEAIVIKSFFDAIENKSKNLG